METEDRGKSDPKTQAWIGMETSCGQRILMDTFGVRSRGAGVKPLIGSHCSMSGLG